MASAAVARVELTRCRPTAAPEAIEPAQVLEHGLRHLAWLAIDDPVVRAELPVDWLAALQAYAPQPFRSLA